MHLRLDPYDFSGTDCRLITDVRDRRRQILEQLTTNRFKGILVGIIFTAIIQSSSACTVMVVSFVNSGLMTLYQDDNLSKLRNLLFLAKHHENHAHKKNDRRYFF